MLAMTVTGIWGEKVFEFEQSADKSIKYYRQYLKILVRCQSFKTRDNEPPVIQIDIFVLMLHDFHFGIIGWFPPWVNYSNLIP